VAHDFEFMLIMLSSGQNCRRDMFRVYFGAYRIRNGTLQRNTRHTRHYARHNLCLFRSTELLNGRYNRFFVRGNYTCGRRAFDL
jgi:hypothetical protein